ncbi:MAG: molybdopterin molybdotransferase MoeA [Chloroflexaceae bacterium]|nr:molybdopterin molybdotransferase MoeA [Chloroflexaceae bacterium]
MKSLQRESPYPMVPVTEAQQIIAAHSAPLPTEAISVLEAAGRVLAADVHSSEAMPDVAKSVVDGYALQASDGRAERRVLAEVVAGGSDTATVAAGTAVRIMTGAPLPDGADAVVMVEETEEQGGMLRVQRDIRSGQNIRTVGQDVGLHELIVPQGAVLGAAEVGLLAMVGITRVTVYRRPRVAIVSTGDEVIEPDAPRTRGEVRDSNRYALLAAIREAGGEPISLGIARDDEDVQRTALLRGFEQADVVLSSGGVSMGTRDLIKPLLAALGTIHFGRVLFKPGKPTTFATVDGKLAFGLPGFPASSLVSFEVFVRPALRRLQGDARPDRPRVQVALSEPIRPSPDRPEYQRIIVVWQDGQLVARSTGPQISSRLLSLRSANGLLIVPPGEAVFQPGATLDALLTGPLVTI